MRKHSARLCVALLTFIVGVCAAALWPRLSERLTAGRRAEKTEVLIRASEPILFAPHCTDWVADTPQSRAVRLAEEFVARNGYTDLPADKLNLSYESVERAADADEMLRLRHDTLERKAYGIRYSGKAGGPRFMVVFRHTARCRCVLDEMGRAVTMDENFRNLRLEHKAFPLANVHIKF